MTIKINKEDVLDQDRVDKKNLGGTNNYNTKHKTELTIIYNLNKQ